MSHPTPHEDSLDFIEEVVPRKRQCANDISKSQGPPSPPTSPANVRLSGERTEETYADPPLYATETKLTCSTPLFPEIAEDEPEESSKPSTKQHINPSLEEDGSMGNVNIRAGSGALLPATAHKSSQTFVSILHMQDPRILFKQTMEENTRYFALARHPRQTKRRDASTIVSTPKSSTVDTDPRLSKREATILKRTITRTSRVTKPAPRRRQATPVRALTPGGPIKMVTVKKEPERRFWLFKDVCPPLSTLDGRDDLFDFVKWGDGESIDLSNDPNRHLLHPAELKAAESLRLPCDRWLVTKRLIFLSVLEGHRNGKRSFKKTDAQKAGVIDVNKSSKMWEAFNSAKWFDAKYFRDY